MSKEILKIKSSNALKVPSHEQFTYYKSATSDNTRRAYQSDIRAFIKEGGRLPCQVKELIRYLESQAAQINPNTLARRITAIKHWHTFQHFPDPTEHQLVKKTMSGILRVHGRPKDQAPAMTLAHLTQWSNYLKQQDTLSARRNRALILVGFFGAFRASELVRLTIENITWEEAGMRILIPQSKTDKRRTGQHVAIPYGNDKLCAIDAVKIWLSAAPINSGVIFRRVSKNKTLSTKALRSNSLNPILKRSAYAAGLPHAAQISSHSLRRGLATEASRRGASMKAIMQQGRWRDTRTVLGYIEAAQAFENNAVDHLF